MYFDFAPFTPLESFFNKDLLVVIRPPLGLASQLCVSPETFFAANQKVVVFRHGVIVSR